jgi:NADH-quinone oxidoreductase subunit M
MIQRTTQGTPNPKLLEIKAMSRDLSLREAVVVAPLIALILLLGFYPKPVIDVINPAVKATMHDVGKTDPKATAGTVEAGK